MSAQESAMAVGMLGAGSSLRQVPLMLIELIKYLKIIIVKRTTNYIFLSFRQFSLFLQVARHFLRAFSTIRSLGKISAHRKCWGSAPTAPTQGYNISPRQIHCRQPFAKPFHKKPLAPHVAFWVETTVLYQTKLFVKG